MHLINISRQIKRNEKVVSTLGSKFMKIAKIYQFTQKSPFRCPSKVLQKLAWMFALQKSKDFKIVRFFCLYVIFLFLQLLPSKSNHQQIQALGHFPAKLTFSALEVFLKFDFVYASL